MPVFRGNVGNLLHNWVLCELLTSWKHYDQIAFIDAYSMAPLANERPRRDQTSDVFDFVRARLPGDGTPYERTWLKLGAEPTEYPNSAAFLTVAWSGPFSLVLCERDAATIAELESWAGKLRTSPKCQGVEIVADDWRLRFRTPLPSSADLTFLSFDPYMFDRHGAGRNPGNMDPTDLERIAIVLEPVQGSVLIQLSTYSANNGNSQADVRQAVRRVLEPSQLEEIAAVCANGNMMSLVYARNVKGLDAVRSLPVRFDAWLNRINYQRARAH